MSDPVADRFMMDLLRTAREHGIREERARVCAWLRTFAKSPYTDGHSFADSIEQGEHDGGRRLPPLPEHDPIPLPDSQPIGDATATTNNGEANDLGK